MAQKCVFCGGVPEKKNKEHVVPQWLSRYLGRYKSVCYLGWVTDAKIPFSGLTFPACTACNSDDADKDTLVDTTDAAVVAQQREMVGDEPSNKRDDENCQQ